MNNREFLEELVTEKMVKIHSIAILSVCFLFGLINAFTNNLPIGLIIIAAGIALGFFGMRMKGIARQTRGMLLSQAQILLIIFASIPKHEVHTMFGLMSASVAICAIYFNKRTLSVQLGIIDVFVLAGLLFRDLFYGDYSIDALIKGIAGINVAGTLIFYLVNVALGNVKAARKAEGEAGGLLEQIRAKMDDNEKMIKKQKKVVADISELTERLRDSSGKMRDISDRLNESTGEEAVTIQQILAEMEEISDETGKCLDTSRQAAVAARHSASLLAKNNSDMQRMVDAMSEIKTTSAQIEGVVKTIEDIAFQTNILALNASVEAARAGAAGRGFAVVAEEVRNLAGKSQQAVKDTSALVAESLAAVQRGYEIAGVVAENMAQVVETAKESETHAERITELNANQTRSVTEIKKHVDQISEIIAKNSQTATRASEGAGDVADGVVRMNNIVSEFQEE